MVDTLYERVISGFFGQKKTLTIVSVKEGRYPSQGYLFSGYDIVAQNNANRICDEIITISGPPSDMSSCSIICSGQCTDSGYNSGEAIYRQINEPDLTQPGCECLCQGCRS